jgi:hypothetical protein
MKIYARRVVLFVMMPSIVAAALLFYFVENPTLCEQEVEETYYDDDYVEDSMAEFRAAFYAQTNNTANVTIHPKTMDLAVVEIECPGAGASVSWWLLFILRQTITFSMAMLTQAFMIDYLTLGCQFVLRCFGPLITLLMVQSKGML